MFDVLLFFAAGETDVVESRRTRPTAAGKSKRDDESPDRFVQFGKGTRPFYNINSR